VVLHRGPFTGPVVRLGAPRDPRVALPVDADVDGVLWWITFLLDEPVKRPWTRREALHLMFLRHIYAHGRLTD